VGVWLGYPKTDPVVGMLITVAILWIVSPAGKTVPSRMLDGIGPELVEETRHIVHHMPGAAEGTEVRARWLGHRLRDENEQGIGPAIRRALSTYNGNTGVPMPVLQLLLGHARAETTMLYTDPLEGAQREAVEQWAGILFPNVPNLVADAKCASKLIQ